MIKALKKGKKETTKTITETEMETAGEIKMMPRMNVKCYTRKVIVFVVNAHEQCEIYEL